MAGRVFWVLFFCLLLVCLTAGCQNGLEAGASPSSPAVSMDPTQGPYPLKVQIQPSGFDGPVSIDFGDSTPSVTAFSTTHIYWSAGNYRVKITGIWNGQTIAKTASVDVVSGVPLAYTALYDELAGRLRRHENRVNAGWNGSIGGMQAGAWLLPANTHAGANMLTPDYWNVTVRYVDALKRLGAKALVAVVGYPAFTPAFNPDSERYIQYFQNLSAEVKKRGLTFVVEHNSLLPGYSALPVNAYYAALKNQLPAGSGIRRWGLERAAEARIIASRVQPDYLILIEEPTTCDSGLGITVEQWKVYVQGVSASLKSLYPGSSTKLGAGCGTWEDRQFTRNWADSPQLDFVELHMYPLASPTTDYFDEFISRLEMVRAAAPGKQLMTVEGWLYKASPQEVSAGVINTDIFARDAYSFWAPLDQIFLEINMKAGHRYGLISMGMAWTRYYFSYLSFGDPSLAGLTSSQILAAANTAAGLAMLNGQASGTGQIFRQLAGGIGFSR